MGGGKSSSSTASTSTTNSSSATATGVVGDAIQGQTIEINTNFPDAAVEVFKDLISLAAGAQTGAKDLVTDALSKNTQVIGNAATPDANIVQGAQKTIIMIAGLAAVAVVAWKVL